MSGGAWVTLVTTTATEHIDLAAAESAYFCGRVAANAEGDGPTWFSGDYAYDGAGNVTAVGTGATYAYDSAGRLIKSMTAGVTETDGYDSFGNLTSRALEGVPTMTTAVDPATNRLTGRLHDAIGNVISDRNGVAYEYDAAGMITGMTATNGQRRRMLYTADDERIATSVSDLTRVRIRDFGGKVLRELTQYQNASWAEWGRDFIYADGVLIAGKREGGLAHRERHYHLDHLGSVRLITTKDGVRVSAHEYLPFGTELTDRTQEYQTFGLLHLKADPMKCTSHERDVTGLDNVERASLVDARLYLPIT